MPADASLPTPAFRRKASAALARGFAIGDIGFLASAIGTPAHLSFMQSAAVTALLEPDGFVADGAAVGLSISTSATPLPAACWLLRASPGGLAIPKPSRDAV